LLDEKHQAGTTNQKAKRSQGEERANACLSEGPTTRLSIYRNRDFSKKKGTVTIEGGGWLSARRNTSLDEERRGWQIICITLESTPEANRAERGKSGQELGGLEGKRAV